MAEEVDSKTPEDPRSFRVTDQIGHILRRASQKHAAIFSELMVPDLTPTRFAAMCLLFERGSLPQNELGRLAAMDIATIKGVIDRLSDRGLVTRNADPSDARRTLIKLTDAGHELLAAAIPRGMAITEKNLDPLSESEQSELIRLLKKIS